MGASAVRNNDPRSRESADLYVNNPIISDRNYASYARYNINS